MTAWKTDKIYESIYQSTFIEVKGKTETGSAGLHGREMNSLQFRCSLLDQQYMTCS